MILEENNNDDNDDENFDRHRPFPCKKIRNIILHSIRYFIMKK